MSEEIMVSVVVPTYNERENVKILCERVNKALEKVPHEIIFVDDSSDDTPTIIAEIQREDPHVRAVHRENKTGLATAVLEGFGLSQGKYIVVMDADLQHPPEILAPMYAAITAEECDFCIPSRFIPGGSDGGLNQYRKFVSATARYIGKAMLSSIRKVSDPTGGLFMFRRECIDGADLQPIGWKILIEVLAMSKYDSICEIPYTFCQREHGESKLSAKVTKEYLQQVWMLRKREVKRGKVRIVRVSPKQLAELAAEGK